MSKRQPRKAGSKKGRQRSHNLETGKYRHTFYKHVFKFGKWRGKKKTLADVRSK